MKKTRVHSDRSHIQYYDEIYIFLTMMYLYVTNQFIRDVELNCSAHALPSQEATSTAKSTINNYCCNQHTFIGIHAFQSDTRDIETQPGIFNYKIGRDELVPSIVCCHRNGRKVQFEMLLTEYFLFFITFCATIETVRRVKLSICFSCCRKSESDIMTILAYGIHTATVYH